MKAKTIQAAGLFLLTTLPIHLQAVSGWTDYGTVAELTPTSHHRFLVRLNISKNPSGCRDKSTFYQDYDKSGADQMFRTLLQAVVYGKQVRLFVTGRCELNGYAEISSVTIVP
ncbi:MAG: hypothetical protein PVF13_07080 [Chromatiales bacterium]|jgi:hypothetical protein